MKFFILLWLCLAVGAANAQEIDFIEADWQSILNKAKEEQKPIFIDCYATWCQPCKYMDESVYSERLVGVFANRNFISVKIQMDSTNKDSPYVRSWYKSAAMIRTTYKVEAYPTMLFLSPDGRLLHRGVGAYPPPDFISLLANATNPDKQYYTLLAAAERRKPDPNTLKYLASFAYRIGDKAIADKYAREYIDNYLLTQPDATVLTYANIDFMSRFVTKSSDKGFKYFEPHSTAIDSVIKQKGLTSGLIISIMQKETVAPYLTKVEKEMSNPDWQMLKTSLDNKYRSAFTNQCLNEAKIVWYTKKNDWPNIIKYNVEKIDSFGYDTSQVGLAFLNNMIWDVIFKHSDDKIVLNKAIGWMEQILWKTRRQTTIDTYANLLYKSGNIPEALRWQQVAILVDEKNAAIEKREPDDRYAAKLVKMNKGLPTW